MAGGNICDLLREWSADPRSPIKLDAHTSEFVLTLNGRKRLAMDFCPFCGEPLGSGGRRISRGRATCRHLAKLAREPLSAVVYRPEYGEYWFAGSRSLKIRLFFCPVCGRRQRIARDDDKHFHKKSPEEVAQLTKLFSEVSSIAVALQRFGPADVDRAGFIEHHYPKGKRTEVGCKRALFYNRLAKTITVAVIEGLDGRIDVRFYAKQKTSGGRGVESGDTGG